MSESPLTPNGPVPPSVARRIEAARARFEAAWQTGPQPVLEEYLAQAPGPEQALLLRELLPRELAYRHARGEPLALEECLRRFPAHTELVEAVYRASAPTVPQPPPQDRSTPPAASTVDQRDATTSPPSGPSTHPRSAGFPEPPWLAGFEFKSFLGRGAFGEVWLAKDLALGQPRAIKRLPRERYSAANLERLRDEAGKMALLPKHRNYVQVHALLPGAADWFLVMEYVAGGPLSRWTFPEGLLPWERAVRYVANVADGLAEVHSHGILHRDVKPANILWDSRRDEALLADFGIAAHASLATGIAGTVGYIAPELEYGAASPRADVFSLAATLYHLATGRPPFDSSSLTASLRHARAGLRRPVAALSGLPPTVAEIILAGLAPDPAERIDLAVFTARLRGAHLQALADRLLALSRRAGARVGLHVAVLTASEQELVFRPAPGAAPAGDEAAAAVVRTGDLLRLETTADADGYLTVLNLGSSGALKVVFPNPVNRDNRIRAGQPQRFTVKLTPPPGTDRAALIWTRRPSSLTPADWQGRIEAGQPITDPSQTSTRGLDLVLHEAVELPEDAWTACVVTVTHRLP